MHVPWIKLSNPMKLELFFLNVAIPCPPIGDAAVYLFFLDYRWRSAKVPIVSEKEKRMKV